MHVVKGVEAAQRQKVQKPQLSSEAFWLAFGPPPPPLAGC